MTKAKGVAEDCMKSFHAVRVIVATGKRLPIVCSECQAKIKAIEEEEG